MRMVIKGPPGAGKGTQAKIIAERFGIPHISTGDLLRVEKANGTDLGIEADRYSREGRYVPDDLVLKMVEKRIEQPDSSRGFLLDGFPRTVPQAQGLDA